jgi:predicted NAD/FAD-binding protein
MLAEGRMWPLFARWNLAGQAAFGILALRARALAASDDDDLLVDDWLRSLPGLTADQRERVLLPWIAALAGCSIDDARRFSARAAVSVPARAMPQSPVEPFTWTTLHGGLGRFVTEFAVACTTLTPRLAAPAIAIERSEHAWTVVTERRRHHDFDHLVFAAPPYALRELIASAPGLEQARTILDGFEYFPTRVAIHTDPLNVHPDRRMWSAYNAITNATHCEGSIWYGALRDLLPDGGTLDVFKSWISARDTEPRELVHQRSFRHPLISPAFHAAQRRLSQHQGRGNVWFTGSYCHDVDLQETALVSAMSVASRLAPQAKNLQALRARVTQRWIDRSAPKQGRGRASGVFSAITGAARRLSRAGAEIRARTKTGQ